MKSTPAVTAHKDAVFTRLGNDSATILNLATKRYYSLNETGIRIWELIEEGEVPTEIAETLANEFDIDAKDARLRVDAFIEDLHTEGLIHQA